MSLGLADQVGDLQDAMDAAARMAGLTEYRTVTYPKVLDPLQQLLQDLMDESATLGLTHLLRGDLAQWQHQMKQIEAMLQYKGAQARLPFVLTR